MFYVQTSGLEGSTWDLVGLGVTASVAQMLAHDDFWRKAPEENVAPEVVDADCVYLVHLCVCRFQYAVAVYHSCTHSFRHMSLLIQLLYRS